MKFFRRSLFDWQKMCTLASMTGVLVVLCRHEVVSDSSDDRPHVAVERARTGHTLSVKPSSSMARIGFSKRNAYFCAGQGVRWSTARQPVGRNVVVGFGERLQHLRRMLFSCSTRYRTGGGRMLLEFDADQRLWQDTVRDAVGKQCPASLVRERRRERRRPGAAVAGLHRCGLDRADRSGERGRAGDRARGTRPRHRSDPVPGDADPVRAARRRPLRPAAGGRGGLRAASPPTATPTAGCSTGRPDTSSTRDRAERLAVVTEAGVFLVDAGDVAVRRSQVFDPVLHIADVSFAGVRLPDTERLHDRRREGPPRRAHRYGDHDGRRMPAHPRPGAGTREAAPAVRRGRSVRSRPSSTRPSTCTSPPSAPARCPTSPR